MKKKHQDMDSNTSNRLTPARWNRKTITWLIIYTCFSSWLLSQSFYVRHYSETSGLPSGLVLDMLQDSQGKMWFATRSGLASYDGSNWKKYTITDGLPVMAFIRLDMDQDGNIWGIASQTHNSISLFYQDGQQWHIDARYQLPENILFMNPPSFRLLPALKPGGRAIPILGSLTNGVFFWRRGQWENLSINQGLPSNNINDMVRVGNKLYIATDNGLAILDQKLGIDQTINQKLGIENQSILGITIEEKDKFPGTRLKHSRLWIYGFGWLGYFEEENMKLVRVREDIYLSVSPIEVRLQADYYSGIYLATAYSIHYYNYQTRSHETLSDRNGLIDNGANRIFVDFEKNLWIACNRGISKLVSRRFRNFSFTNGMLEDEVTAILEYEPGKFVLGHNRGVSYYDGQTFQPISLVLPDDTGVKILRVMDLAIDRKKNIWAAFSEGGLIKISQDRKVTRFNDSQDNTNSIISVKVDHDDFIWFSTIKGLYRWHENSIDQPFNRLEYKGYVRKIFTKNGSIHMCVTDDSGFLLYNPIQKKWTRFQHPSDSAVNSVYSIYELGPGHFLVGSKAGLYEVENNQFKKIFPDVPALRRPIYVIYKDRRNRFWFGSDYGLARIDGQNMRTYSTSEGLIGPEINRAAFYEDRQGHIWIGTNRGLSIYNENYDLPIQNIPPPKLRLIDIDVQDNHFPLTSPIQLSFNQNSISFHFNGISLINEEEIRFKTKLEGFEKNWSNENYPYQQTVRYTNLIPGTYRFFVKARNALGVWSDVKISPPIVILRPFYQQWWFFLLVGAATALLLFSIFKLISDRQHATHLEREVKERTDELQVLENRYRALFEDTKDIVFITKPGGEIIDMNPAGVARFGYHSREEMISQITSIELYQNPETRELYRKEMEEKGFVRDYEVQFKDRFGEIIIGRITATVVRDHSGEIIAFRGIVRDVTENMRLEQQLFQAQKMEAIGTLAGGIAHDFNNILGVIVGYTELALEDLPTNSEVHRNVEQILVAATRATELVRQILAFSRRSESKRMPLLLDIIVKEALKLLRPSLPSTIEIKTHVKTGYAKVFGDPTQLHQVILNLCTNAAHAMKERGGILEVSLDSTLIASGHPKGTNGLQPGPYVVLSVSDTGHGIPPVVMKRIFDPFFTTKKTGEGTGMGLAMIHGIVKSHHGDISVNSEMDNGTTFHVYLPQVDDKVEPVSSDNEPTPTGTERILLVDDEVGLAQVGKQMLERLGYEVVGLSDPIEALHVFQKKPQAFDLVISDLTMPRMTGIQLAKKIKEIRPGIPVILSSGFSDRREKDALSIPEVDEFIIKPIVKSEIGRLVRRLLDKKK